MRVVILYRPDSEHARAVETFLHDFQARNGSVKIEVLNVDEREGIAMVNLYDVMRYPTIIAMADDGTVLNMWEGDELPRMDDVASYAYSGQ
jgi:thioredoxin-like negative regulator of GroEL